MHIELQASGMKLPLDYVRELKQRLQQAFEGLGVLLVRVLLKAGEAAGRRGATRECVVEVHLPDGQVTYVAERQRHLGALMRRAVARAWAAVKPAARTAAGTDSAFRPRAQRQRPSARRGG